MSSVVPSNLVPAEAVMGMEFHNVTVDTALRRLEALIAGPRDSPRRVFCPNVALYVWARHDPWLAKFYRSCDLVTCDGRGIYFASRLLRTPIREPVSGARLMFELLPRAEVRRYKIFILGATDDVLRDATAHLAITHPGLRVVGTHHGYYEPAEADLIADEIARTGADVVFLAMSTPKKERFAAEHGQRAGCPVFLGVGGAIDVIAGRTKLAPGWISTIGFEWLYRLLQEPRRLWRRYLTTNAFFAYYFAREWLTQEHRNQLRG